MVSGPVVGRPGLTAVPIRPPRCLNLQTPWSRQSSGPVSGGISKRLLQINSKDGGGGRGWSSQPRADPKDPWSLSYDCAGHGNRAQKCRVSHGHPQGPLSQFTAVLSSPPANPHCAYSLYTQVGLNYVSLWMAILDR